MSFSPLKTYLASSYTPKHTKEFTLFDGNIDILKGRLHGILVPGEITPLDRQYLRSKIHNQKSSLV